MQDDETHIQIGPLSGVDRNLQPTKGSTRPEPFRVKAKKIGLPAEWTSGCVAELIEMLEGQLHR
jgi:hypothetical protein